MGSVRNYFRSGPGYGYRDDKTDDEKIQDIYQNYYNPELDTCPDGQYCSIYAKSGMSKTTPYIQKDAIQVQTCQKCINELSAMGAYEAFKNLTPIAASNKLLWATLTHKEFKKYTIKRWPLKKNEKDRGLINSHFFFDKDDRRAYRRNAISRLWWGTCLTVSPWEKDTSLLFLKSDDEYKFTKIMLGSQQLWFDIQERRWGCDVVYRTCFLEAFYRLIMSKMHERCSLSPTDFSNELAKLFTASLVHDVDLVLRKDPEKIIDYIFELSRILLNRAKTN